MAPAESARPRTAWEARGNRLVLLVTVAGLAVGAVLHGVGAGSAGDAAWTASAACAGLRALAGVVTSVRRGRLGVDVVAVLAVVGALAVGEVLAAAVIGLMIASGSALEEWAAGRASRDLEALLRHAPRLAHRYSPDGLETIALDEVVVGDRLLVATGETVPVDGTVRSPGAVLDESALTGEALPVEHGEGSPVRSGCVNAGGAFDIVAGASAADSTYAGIVQLVQDAKASRGPFVRLADRFAAVFLGGSLVLAGAAWSAGGAARAVAVLVVATPCPLILAAPVALVGGVSRAARRGVIVKGAGVLERLARCRTLLVDKTGTLTSGKPAIEAIYTDGSMDEEQVLQLAASLDQASSHPLGAAIVDAARARGRTLLTPENVEEVPGAGIAGRVGDRSVRVGTERWAGVVGTPAWMAAARRKARLSGAATVTVAIDGDPVGVVVLDDPIRLDAARTVRHLRRGGIARIVLVTGDRSDVAESVGAVIGVDEVMAEQTPAGKLEAVRIEQRRAPVAMVGDGINDAPALALADVGVAMGARGAAAPSEVADVVLTVDRIDPLGDALSLAWRSRHLALQSIAVGMGLSVAAMAMAAAGLLPALWGAILQEGIDVAVILNALRALRPLPTTGLQGADAAMSDRFRSEHAVVRAALAEIRAVADAVGNGDSAALVARARALHEVLVTDVLAHEAAEEMVLYPAVAKVLGGIDPTAPMSRAHVEIGRQVRRLGQLLDDIGPGTPDPLDLVELRAILYGLHAVLRLHTVQEEESYLSLTEGATAVRGTIARSD